MHLYSELNMFNISMVGIVNKVQGNKQPSAIPSRAPPPPPPQKNIERGSPTPAWKDPTHQTSSKETDRVSTPSATKGGTFWSTQYAPDTRYEDTNTPPRTKPSNTENQLARNLGSNICFDSFSTDQSGCPDVDSYDPSVIRMKRAFICSDDKCDLNPEHKRKCR